MDSHQSTQDSDFGLNLHVDKLSAEATEEIVQLLQVKTSMLAIGACERIKKIARVHPKEIAAGPILPELLKIISEVPATPLAGASMSALATLSLSPEGRQQICMMGGFVPLIRFIANNEISHPNVDKAVSLLMNLSADQMSRRQIREAGAVEVLVNLMKTAPLEPIMEHTMGALHNVMLTDAKATKRAADAGIAYGLARVLAARLPEGHKLNVRARMIIGDLLQIPDIQARLVTAAQELKLRLPSHNSFGDGRHSHTHGTSNAAARVSTSAGVDVAAMAAEAVTSAAPQPGPGPEEHSVVIEDDP